MNHLSEVSIVTPTALYVQRLAEESEPPKKQVRVIRSEIGRSELDPIQRARGRHIARRLKKGRSVRIPAMSGEAWGHMLRALELKRSFN